MVLVQKWDFFHLFIFGKIGKKKVFVDLLERKNAFLHYKNKQKKKIIIEKLAFSKGVSPWFWSKNGIFSHMFIFGKILKEKKALFQIIKTKSKKLNWPFTKRWDVFIFGKIENRKSLAILQKEKTPFSTIKTRSKKKSKNWPFPKGLVHGFGQKMGLFPPFLFQRNRAQKSLCRYSGKKKNAFLDYKKKKQKKLKNWAFSKRVSSWF